MIQISDVSVISNCEHHFVTIDGKSGVAYVPQDSTIGLTNDDRTRTDSLLNHAKPTP